MMSPEELNVIDETLSVQLRLALASPLWKNLPYGLQINPRAWGVDLLEVRPRRRLCARITIPWLPGAARPEPLHFLMMIWRSDHGGGLHRLLSRLNQRLARPAQQPARRTLFYDALSHAFITQFRPRLRAQPDEAAPFDLRWARRLFLALLRGLKRQDAR